MQSGHPRIAGKTGPLLGAELHAPLIVESGFVLQTECHPKELVARGFSICNMSLKLNGIRPRVRGGIYEHVRRAERPVMGLCHLRNQIGRGATADGAA